MPNSEIRREAVNTRVVKLQPLDRTKRDGGKSSSAGGVESGGARNGWNGSEGLKVSEEPRYVGLHSLRDQLK